MQGSLRYIDIKFNIVFQNKGIFRKVIADYNLGLTLEYYNILNNLSYYFDNKMVV